MELSVIQEFINRFHSNETEYITSLGNDYPLLFKYQPTNINLGLIFYFNRILK